MKYEILSPAGSLEKLKWALIYGADAVYFGGERFNLRANSNNFTMDEIKEAVEFAHNLNKKVYITVNMIFHNDDLEGLDEYLIELDKLKVDALIVSDLSVIKHIKDLKLSIPFHISTQQSTCNKYTVKFFEDLGAERVVLARECSKEDIIDIRKNTSVELEAFIHGAMCTSYSGRCVLSNYLTKRDSNRGGCAQVCRFTFNMDNNEELFSFSCKDLNMINYAYDMIKNGIYSLKIEGRMRSIYYIATIVSTYKRLIDKSIMNNLGEDEINYYMKVVKRCANRESTPQFYDKLPTYTEQYYIGRNEESNQDFLGVVLDYDETKKEAIIEQRNFFKVGDTIEVFGPNKEAIKLEVTSLINEDGDSVDAARHPQEKLRLKTDIKLDKYDILRVVI